MFGTNLSPPSTPPRTHHPLTSPPRIESKKRDARLKQIGLEIITEVKRITGAISVSEKPTLDRKIPYLLETFKKYNNSDEKYIKIIESLHLLFLNAYIKTLEIHKSFLEESLPLHLRNAVNKGSKSDITQALFLEILANKNLLENSCSMTSHIYISLTLRETQIIKLEELDDIINNNIIDKEINKQRPSKEFALIDTVEEINELTKKISIDKNKEKAKEITEGILDTFLGPDSPVDFEDDQTRIHWESNWLSIRDTILSSTINRTKRVLVFDDLPDPHESIRNKFIGQHGQSAKKQKIE